MKKNLNISNALMIEHIFISFSIYGLFRLLFHHHMIDPVKSPTCLCTSENCVNTSDRMINACSYQAIMQL